MPYASKKTTRKALSEIYPNADLSGFMPEHRDGNGAWQRQQEQLRLHGQPMAHDECAADDPYALRQMADDYYPMRQAGHPPALPEDHSLPPPVHRRDVVDDDDEPRPRQRRPRTSTQPRTVGASKPTLPSVTVLFIIGLGIVGLLVVEKFVSQMPSRQSSRR